jgi:uncharacterized protein YgfB (UPF0149 family)
MDHKAISFIEVIAGNLPEVDKSLNAIRDVLEDGEALVWLGVTDGDRDMVEEAHAMVSDWIKAGLSFL